MSLRSVTAIAVLFVALSALVLSALVLSALVLSALVLSVRGQSTPVAESLAPDQGSAPSESQVVAAQELSDTIALPVPQDVAEAVKERKTASEAVAAMKHPPGSFVQVFVPRADAGMRCPDGSFLPPLNGVSVSDPIPVIQRESFMPPIGEIRGKYTDATGVAWWVTSDGSCFTVRWVSQRMPSGEMVRMLRLDQSDALPADFAVTLAATR